jgi:hypothetical protein
MTAAQSPLTPIEHIVDMWFENADAWLNIQRTWVKMFLKQKPSALMPGMQELARYTNGASPERAPEPAGQR